MHICGRYAPSPSGPLHIGNLRTALLAWLQARLVGGRFILRIEDLDAPRIRRGATEQLMDDLRWLGLDWDEGPDIGGPSAPYVQSQRLAQYQTVFETLLKQKVIFPCFCSRKDISEAASAPHGNNGSIYPGTCRHNTHLTVLSQPPSWRYAVPEVTLEWHDHIVGGSHHELARETGDFVIRRADGVYAYQLAVVVDDIAMGITDVVRGADLWDSTPRQIQLYRTLQQSSPRYWHVPLYLDEQGQRMAKRNRSTSLASWREQGKTPAQVVAHLAASVSLVPDTNALSAQELLQELAAVPESLTQFTRKIQAHAHGSAKPSKTVTDRTS